VALVIRVGFFCTGGHTELGSRFIPPDEVELAAIDAFLRKISGDIDWRRAFPAREKPGPKYKPGGARASFKDPKDGGVTGTTLVGKMRDRLRHHYRGALCDLDVVAVIDDADCRFLEDGALARWATEIEQDVRAWTERPAIRFIPLLASPEAEAWMLADWEEGLGREYAQIQVLLGRALERDVLGPRPWKHIEDFGGPYDPERGSCTRKLSTEVQKVLEALAMEKGGEVDRRTYAYSKRENGPDMLRRLRPDKAAELCRRVLMPALIELRALAKGSATGPAS
jgi:hypothetical protein